MRDCRGTGILAQRTFSRNLYRMCVFTLLKSLFQLTEISGRQASLTIERLAYRRSRAQTRTRRNMVKLNATHLDATWKADREGHFAPQTLDDAQTTWLQQTSMKCIVCRPWQSGRARLSVTRASTKLTIRKTCSIPKTVGIRLLHRFDKDFTEDALHQ